MKSLLRSGRFAIVLLTIAFSLWYPFSGHSQTFDFKPLERSTIHTAAQIKTHGLNDTIVVSDDKWDEMVSTSSSWGNNFKFKSVHAYVRFSVNHAYANKVIDPYTVRLAYKIYGYSNPATPTVASATYNDTLTISYKPDSLAYFQDKQYKKYNNFHKIMVVLTGFYKIDGANAVPQWIDLTSNNFSLYNFNVEGAIVFQPFDKRVKHLNTYYNAYGSGAVLNIDKSTPTNDYLPVRWHFATPLTEPMAMKPVKYELEWTYIDNYKVNIDNGTVSTIATSNLKYDFTDNATRIWLDTNYYRIPLIYQKGHLIYRVRLVRPDSIEYKYPIYGPWTLVNATGTVSSITSTSIYEITNAHINDSLNWQYTVSFAEQGKYKHVMSYYDGMLKNRQSITRFNSLADKLIATEQIYDYEGRPSISILPTPINSLAFKYQLNLALNKSTNLPYRPQDFDALQLFTCPADIKVPPLSDNSFADIYYSPTNPDKVGYQKFVPDAGGYPFVQTVYSPGYDERVEKQGGAGDTLQIGYGHTVKNDYVGSEQTDLNRLFGTNIGWAGFYRKTVSRDPNGQLSLNVTDYKGKTVMSSMVGLPDTAMHALISNENLADTVQYNEDFIAGTTQQVAGNKIILDKNFFNEAGGNNIAQYVFCFKPFQTFCNGKYLSVKAKFDYTIFDECGIVRGHKDSVLGVSGLVTSPLTDTFFQNPTLGFNMEKGKHSLHKELTINTDEVALAVDSFMASSQVASCLKTEPWFIKESVLSKEFPCPDELKDADCDDCAGRKYEMMKELYPNEDSVYVKKKYGIYRMINGVVVGNANSDFTLLCGHGTNPSQWGVAYPAEVIEVKPGTVLTVGNWSNVTTVNGTPPSAPNGPFVVLTGNDTLNCKYRYQDACVVTMPASITKAGVVYTNLQQIPVEDFINVFNDSIAAALLPLHPEYCKLLECVDDVFERKMRSIPNANIAGQLSLLTLTQIINADPLLAAMQSHPTQYPNAFDTLAYYSGGVMGLNKVALTQAYCGTTDNNMFETCQSSMFQTEIAAGTLSNDYVKEKYFKTIRDIYLANRTKYLFNLSPGLAGSPACAVCQPIRMHLVPEPVFPDNTATITSVMNNLTGIGNINVTTQSTGLTAVNQYLTLTNTINLDTLQNLSDSAVNIYVATSDTVISVALDSMMAQFVNCIIPSGGSINGVRSYLWNLYATGQVPNLQFTPAQVLAALTANNITRDDLCNPYIVNYDGLLTPPENPESGGILCGGQDFFVDFTAFLNGNTKSALQNIGNNYSITLSGSTNQFAVKLAAVFSGSTSCNVVAAFSSAQQLYTLTYSAGSTSMKLYVKAAASGTCQYPFVAGPGETVSLEAQCNKDVFGGFPAGYVGNYSFAIIAKHITSTSTTSCQLKAWNNKIIINKLGDNILANAVPFAQFKKLYKQFWDTCTVYGVKAAMHPYYSTMLRNFMNYNLKKTFTGDQYLDFVESSALADSMLVKNFVSYQLSFSDSTGAFNFINALNSYSASVNISPTYVLKYTVYSSYSVSVSLLGVPKNKLRLIHNYLTAYPSVTQYYNFTFQELSGYGNSWMGYMVVPAGTPVSTATIFNGVSNGFSFTNAGNYEAWNGTSFQLCNTYNVFTPLINDLPGNARKMKILEDFVNSNMSPAAFIPGIKHGVNSEYYLSEKQGLLKYNYNNQNLPVSAILDTIQATYLQSGITALNGKQVSYGHPAMPGNIQNLYIGDPATATNNTNYAKLQYILSQVSNHLGGTLFFTGSNTINIPIGSGQQLTAYRCRDTAYWYRYFGPGDTLYNVFLKVPAYIDPALRPGYIVQGYSYNLGEGDSRSFRVVLKNVNAPIVNLQLDGFTDFTVAKNKVLHDVLLTHAVDEGVAIADTVVNCERSRLTTAIYQGKINYKIYIDSIRTRLKSDFFAHIMNGGISEKLYISYRNQRFNYTLYGYDRAGNLIATVPPAGVLPISNNLQNVDNYRTANDGSVVDPMNNKVSVYHYNTLNQVVNQSTPDGGITEFYYDAAGRVIFSQNAKQREKGYMTYTLYDKQGRIMETGATKISCVPYFDPYPSQNVITASPCSYYLDGMQTPFPPQVQQLKSYAHEDIVTYVRSLTREEVVLTKYDEQAIDLMTQASISGQENLRKRVAAIKYFDFLQPSDSSFNQYSYAMHFSYDIAGNVKTLVRDYPAWSRISQRFKRVDYDYDVISGKVNLLSYNRSNADQFYQRYAYDDDNRITEVETSNDGIIWQKDAGYQYYQHGPLARMTLGQLAVQGVDYAYTIQGWLKSVNGDLLDTARDMGNDGTGNSIYAKDAVALSLDYFKGDYKPIGTIPVTHIEDPLKNMYNGNIPRATTSIAPYPTLNTRYVYDQLNRIMKAQYAYVNPYDGTMSNTADYYSSYAYDPDGNLKKLVRNGNTVGGNSQLMDSMTYHYQSNAFNNKLQNITDFVDNNFNNDIKHYINTGASRYLYDQTGNVVKDLVSGQDTIRWNHYNKVTETRNETMNNGLRFAYDGAGQRYLKVVAQSAGDSTEERSDYYVRDAQGNILAVYDQNESYKMTKREWIEYISLQYMIRGVSTFNFLDKVIKPYFAREGAFRESILSQTANLDFENNLLESYPVSFFTVNNAIKNNLLAHSGEHEDFYNALAAYSVDKNKPLLADGLYGLLLESEDYDREFVGRLLGDQISNEMKQKVLELLCTNADSLFNYTVSQFPAVTTGDCASKVQTVMSNINDDPAFAQNLAYELTKAVHGYGFSSDYLSFLRALAIDNDVVSYAPYTSEKDNGALLEYFRLALDNHINPQAMGLFFNSWEPSRSLLYSTTDKKTLRAIAFDGDPVGYINNYQQQYSGNFNFVYDALYTLPWLTPGHYIDRWVWSTVIVDSVVHTVYSNVLKSERISLGEHHLYGSSRLGIKKYLPGQYYSLHDYSGPQPLTDTISLTTRKPWYSLEYKDVISGLAQEPYGMTELSSFYTDNLIGQRQYELTNHLGNVQATVSDYPSYHATGSNNLITDHNPALVTTYDYYPFGMLMPGRGSDSMIGQSNVQGNILIVNNDFSDGTLQGFTESGEANNENGRVKVGVHGPWYGMYRDVSLIPGRAYRARIDYDGGNFQQIGHFMFAVLALGSTLDFKYLWGTANGYELNFVVPSGASSVRVALQTPGEQASGVNAYCYLDNFIIEEIKPQTVINPETNNGCITMTQPKWVTTMVDSCYYQSTWPWWKYTLLKTNGDPGTGVAPTVALPGVSFNISSGEFATFSLATIPDQRQEVEFEVSVYKSGSILQFTEEKAGVEVSLGSVNLKGTGTNTIYITPTGTEVKVKLIGPAQWTMRRICVKRPSLKQENVLVTICPDDKDHYRFGFNGQEKVNEWSGIGNHNTAEFWEYDTRTGRRLNLDPAFKEMPNESPYATNHGNPIVSTDLEGDFGLIGAIVGAVAGAAIEYGTQAVSNLIQGKSLKDAFVNDIDFADVLISGLEGGAIGATGGASLIVKSTVTVVTKIAASTARVAIDYTPKEGTKSIGGFIGDKKNGKDILWDAGSEILGASVGHGFDRAGAGDFVRSAPRNFSRGWLKKAGQALGDELKMGAVQEGLPTLLDGTLKRETIETELILDGYEDPDTKKFVPASSSPSPYIQGR